ncbi:unnamed protein product [Paramecium sonneborni]|uniref:G domain-containing protein n=1 Tax=Paramecium sonneborni TaxID=65129 RepID=A0A8S1QV91_9CILI|nr:unnamed protein product [Paramecium sonneborni]
MPQIVLIGKIGSGKTTLYNKITGSNEKVQQGGRSVTLAAFQKNSIYGRGFTVLDTPGIGAQDDKMKCYGGILAALSEGPLNRIMIVENHARVDYIVKEIKERTKVFARYKPMITAVITCFDFSENPQNDKEFIINNLAKLNIRSVMFVGIKDSGISICQQIDQILLKSVQQQVELLDSEYLTHFDLNDYEDKDGQFQYQLECDSEDSLREFRKVFNIIQQTITEFPNTEPDLSNKLQALIQFTKSQTEAIVNKFLKKNDHIYQKLLAKENEFAMYLVHNQLKKELANDIEKIVKLTQKKLQSNAQHCFNYIKKCNFCNAIWLKVDGCEGLTYCGSVSNTDILQKQEEAPQQYDVKIVGIKIILEVNLLYLKRVAEIQKIAIKEIVYIKALVAQKAQKQKRNVFRAQSGKTITLGEFGCGQLINWNTMIPLNEGELNELVDPGLIDYYRIQDDEVSRKMHLYKQALISKLEKEINLQKNHLKNQKKIL